MKFRVYHGSEFDSEKFTSYDNFQFNIGPGDELVITYDGTVCDLFAAGFWFRVLVTEHDGGEVRDEELPGITADR